MLFITFVVAKYVEKYVEGLEEGAMIGCDTVAEFGFGIVHDCPCEKPEVGLNGKCPCKNCKLAHKNK